MKTERRHELQTNTLAASLNHWIEAAKPYSRAVLAGVIAIVMALFAWAYISNQGARREAEGWTEYFHAMNTRDPVDALRDIAERYSGSSVAHWARLTLADLELSSGTNRLFTDRTLGRDQLREAKQRYDALILETSDPTISQRATYGLARTTEALGELAAARASYEKLVKDWPDGPFKSAAEARLKDLERADTKDFYDWFAKYEPPKPLSKEPGTPGARPDFLQEPTSGGGLNLPSAIDDNTPLPSAPAAEAEAPAATSDAPTEENPAEPAPAPSDAAPAPADNPEDGPQLP